MEDYKDEKIAIHHVPGSFSERWIAYCEEKHISYKIVNAYDSDIIEQLSDCTAFMWHHHHANYKDVLFAKQLLYSLQIAGKKVFPDFNTTWHFDDKVGQKYLLEAIGAPLVPSYVFYDKKTALQWVENASFPKVFKLRGGAGACNVRLVHSKREGKSLVRKAFNRGFLAFEGLVQLREAYRKFCYQKGPFVDVLKGVVRLFWPTLYTRMHGREKGYVYFQDFIPDNDFDVRLIVIKDKAYGMRRMCRKNDFRASGSSDFAYAMIDEKTLQVAFDIAEKLSLQSVAFDFIYDSDGNPLVVEMSYGYGTKGSSKCHGYWTKDLQWHEGVFNPFSWQIENLLSK